MGLWGPGKPNADHTQSALKERQSTARMQDTNASAHANKLTLSELLKLRRR